MLESFHCASNLAVTFWRVILWHKWNTRKREGDRERWGKAASLIWSLKMSDMRSESGESTEAAVRQPCLSLLKCVCYHSNLGRFISTNAHTYSGSLFNFLTDMDTTTNKIRQPEIRKEPIHKTLSAGRTRRILIQLPFLDKSHLMRLYLFFFFCIEILKYISQYLIPRKTWEAK